MTTSTAQAFANIAFTKYWGNRDNTLRLPVNGSIPMNLDGLYMRTTAGLNRISYILDIIRGMAVTRLIQHDLDAAEDQLGKRLDREVRPWQRRDENEERLISSRSFRLAGILSWAWEGDEIRS